MPPTPGRSISTLGAPSGPAAVIEANFFVGFATIAITATWRSVLRPWRGSSEARRLARSPMVPCAAKREAICLAASAAMSGSGIFTPTRRRLTTRLARPHVGLATSFQEGRQVPVPSWGVRGAGAAALCLAGPTSVMAFFFNFPSDRPRAESRGEPRDKTRRNHKTASMHRIFRRKRQRQRREKNGEMRHNGHTNTSNATRGLRDLFHGGFSRGANAGKRGVAACPRAQARSTCRALSHRRRRVCAGSAAVSPPAGRGA